MSEADTRGRAAVIAARRSYGKLLSWLAWRWRDIAAAEDALADAYLAALEDWPRKGTPEVPEAWLMQVAKRKLITAARRQARSNDLSGQIVFDRDPAETPRDAIADDRLRLMFVCAHPAIQPDIRCALMLQTVLGIDAARIGEAFLVSREAMTKRLVRAKAKIKAAGVRFEEPSAQDMPARVDSVLEAIYGAYVLRDREAPGSLGASDLGASDLGEEAVYLASLVAAFLPRNAEAQGLLALLQFCEARAPARLTPEGEFTPLDRQNADLWDRETIRRANVLLAQAAALHDPGPFQIEAAIQSAHCHRVHGGEPPWDDIVALYERLLGMAPTLGARLAHAVAVAHASGDPHAALGLLAAIEARALDFHQPLWATRAYLLAEAGENEPAAIAYARALALSRDPAVRRHLWGRITALRGLPN